MTFIKVVLVAAGVWAAGWGIFAGTAWLVKLFGEGPVLGGALTAFAFGATCACVYTMFFERDSHHDV